MSAYVALTISAAAAANRSRASRVSARAAGDSTNARIGADTPGTK